MEKVILKKEDGNVIKSVRKVLGGKELYITDKDGSLANEINFSEIKLVKAKDINEVDKAFKRLFDSLIKLSEIKRIYKAMDNLKKIKTRDELLELTTNVFEEYKTFISTLKRKSDVSTFDSIYSVINELLEDNPDLVMAVFVRKLIISYYEHKIRSLGARKVNDLENLKLGGASIDYMFEIIGETFTRESVSNGIYTLSKKLFADSIDTVFDDLQEHLCALDCANFLRCPKVLDKRQIGYYGFINSGYQTFNDDGTLDRFIVTDCEYYEREYQKVFEPAKRKQKVKQK